MDSNLMVNSSDFCESVVEFSSSNDLGKSCDNIGELSNLLSAMKARPEMNLRVICKSSMILLLLPALIALKDRLRVEIQFNEESQTDFLDTNVSAKKNRDFKELLETQAVLERAGLETMFSRKLISN
jgi:hypothetical protein